MEATAWLLITPFVTCWSSSSGCCAWVCIHSALKSLLVLGLLWVGMLSVQMFARSRSSVCSIMWLLLSWVQFAFYSCALLILYNKNLCLYLNSWKSVSLHFWPTCSVIQVEQMTACLHGSQTPLCGLTHMQTDAEFPYNNFFSGNNVWIRTFS